MSGFRIQRSDMAARQLHCLATVDDEQRDEDLVGCWKRVFRNRRINRPGEARRRRPAQNHEGKM